MKRKLPQEKLQPQIPQQLLHPHHQLQQKKQLLPQKRQLRLQLKKGLQMFMMIVIGKVLYSNSMIKFKNN